MRRCSTGVWDEGKDLKMKPHLTTGILWDETGYLTSNLSLTAVFCRLIGFDAFSSSFQFKSSILRGHRVPAFGLSLPS